MATYSSISSRSSRGSWGSRNHSYDCSTSRTENLLSAEVVALFLTCWVVSAALAALDLAIVGWVVDGGVNRARCARRIVRLAMKMRKIKGSQAGTVVLFGKEGARITRACEVSDLTCLICSLTHRCAGTFQACRSQIRCLSSLLCGRACSSRSCQRQR